MARPDAYEKRALWEPLLEVSQAKGDSEAHPFISTEDEFADFETWDFGNAGLPKQNDMLEVSQAKGDSFEAHPFISTPRTSLQILRPVPMGNNPGRKHGRCGQRRIYELYRRKRVLLRSSNRDPAAKRFGITDGAEAERYAAV